MSRPFHHIASALLLAALCGGPVASVVCAALCDPADESGSMAGHAAMSCHKVASAGSQMSGAAASPQCVDHDAVLSTGPASTGSRGEQIALLSAAVPVALEGVRESAARGAPPRSSPVLPLRPLAASLVLRI